MITFRVLRLLCVLCLLCVPCVSSGCGYSLAGRGAFLPTYIQTIGVPEFVNRTPVFNLETQLTQKVRSEFIGRGKYKVAPETANADAVLTGEVLSVTSTPSNFSSTSSLASRYTIRMVAKAELRDERDKKILWQNGGLVFSQDFEVQSGTTNLDPTSFFGQDQNALDRMTTDFARTIVSAILEAF